MAIVFVDAGTAASNTITVPSLQIGDLVIGLGFAPNSTSVTIDIPAEWIEYQVASASGSRSRAAAARFVDNGSFAFGEWTNAEKVTYLVFRSDEGRILLTGGLHSSASSLSANLVTYPAVSTGFASNVLEDDIRRINIGQTLAISVGNESTPTGFSQIHRSTVANSDLVIDLSDGLVTTSPAETKSLSEMTEVVGYTVLIKELEYAVPSATAGFTGIRAISRRLGT